MCSWQQVNKRVGELRKIVSLLCPFRRVNPAAALILSKPDSFYLEQWNC